MALLGAASSYFAYQKKKLCFKVQGGEYFFKSFLIKMFSICYSLLYQYICDTLFSLLQGEDPERGKTHQGAQSEPQGRPDSQTNTCICNLNITSQIVFVCYHVIAAAS